jgi:hypothetical protein
VFFQELFKDLLIQLKEQYPDINAYSLVGKLGEVKKFENLSNDLKSFLVRESILFVGSASKRIEDLAAILENQEQQIRSDFEYWNKFTESKAPCLFTINENEQIFSKDLFKSNQVYVSCFGIIKFYSHSAELCRYFHV